MEQQFIAFAAIIASYLIELNASGYNFENPFQWASGTFNPFYVDNRKLISIAKIRKVLREALAALVANVKVDYVYGIPKAGIAPATLLALELQKPLVIKNGGKYYAVDILKARKFVQDNLTEFMKSADVVAGTSPLGIILGIIIAEELEKPFLFVRKEPKGHGLQQQVEGVIEKDSFSLLIDPELSGFEQYSAIARRALQDEGIKVLTFWQPSIGSFVYEVSDADLKGKNVVGMEDLVSTGESSLNEIRYLQNMGAIVHPCSIFSYNLDSAVRNFKEYGLTNKCILNFEDILAQYELEKRMPLSDMLKLTDWYQNQPTWGDNNGHPAVKK